MLKIKKNDFNLIFLLLAALLVRVIFIESRPPHADEGVACWFADQIAQTGLFKYDPTNFHGPLHYYFLFIVQSIVGVSMSAFRVFTALFGVACVWVMTKFDFLVGRKTAFLAAAFLAFSPGVVFYSRYATQEIDLLLFTLIAIYAYFKNKPWPLVLSFVALVSTKETWAISFVSFVLAITATKQWKKIENLVPALVGGFVLWFLLFSGFFKNLLGPIDFFKAFLPWLKTGHSGAGHEKPVSYFLKLIFRQELPSFLGIIFSIRFLYSKNKEIRFFTLYGVLQLIFYSFISYKTPWCALEIIWPFMIVSAAGLWELADQGKLYKRFVFIFATTLTIVTFVQSVRLSVFHNTDENEPYVYVQTYKDIQKIMEIVRLAPLDTSVLVALSSYWPLPWLFQDYKNTGFYDKTLPDNLTSDIIFSDSSRKNEVIAKLQKSYYIKDFKLRPAMGDVTVYFSKNMFEGKLKASDYELIETEVKK